MTSRQAAQKSARSGSALRITQDEAPETGTGAWPADVEFLEGELRIDHSTAPPVLRYRGLIEPLSVSGPARRHRMAVRMLDLVLVIPLLLVAAPIMLVLLVVVRTTSPGPAIYRSKRITRGGRYFNMFKFRTMVENGTEVLDEFFALNPRARELYRRDMKLRDDPRLTSIGRFLRRWSLDELPQLINVLRGHMSLVGPRPLLEEEFGRFGGAGDTVVLVKGGLTGLWQVTGRNLLTFEERVPLEIRYVRTRTLSGDVRILLRTARDLFRGFPGAY